MKRELLYRALFDASSIGLNEEGLKEYLFQNYKLNFFNPNDAPDRP